MTYSIVGANNLTREAGGAGTSCLSGSDVYVIYAARPGHGVVHAQATYSAALREQAAALLDAGQSPTAIIDAITQSSFDASSAIRQYGIVDVQGRSAAFTGAHTMPYAGDRRGATGTFVYSAQGNILTSEKVLTQAASAFEARGCDLAERLMNALEAGALSGEGDNRCVSRGIPSDSAFIQVESPDLGLGQYLSLRVQSSGEENPLPQLRAKFDAWRVEHPCPRDSATSAAASAGSDAGCGCVIAGTARPASGFLGVLLVVLSLVGRRRFCRRPTRSGGRRSRATHFGQNSAGDAAQSNSRHFVVQARHAGRLP